MAAVALAEFPTAVAFSPEATAVWFPTATEKLPAPPSSPMTMPVPAVAALETGLPITNPVVLSPSLIHPPLTIRSPPNVSEVVPSPATFDGR
ncbi:hypothetical protein DDK21_28680 [Achromobacter xylosoxidans]|nr:hypothetical protein DDK21_28680 [Achromobacter xylosoxidans]